MIARTSMMDRRKHPRLENNIPIKICQEEGDIVTETRNISRAGVYCRIQKSLPLMTKLGIHLLLSFKKNGKSVTKKIFCQGVVVRVEPIKQDNAYYAAIFFNDISAKDTQCIAEYMQKNSTA